MPKRFFDTIFMILIYFVTICYVSTFIYIAYIINYGPTGCVVLCVAVAAPYIWLLASVMDK